MGLSAWKQFGQSRWALRVNPSSGNLHPTETYVVRAGRVWHYAVREHAIEERCVFTEPPSGDVLQDPPGEAAFLVALSSVHWREAWKYGERSFRYCQHDVGHAIGALRLAAGMLGWRLTLLPEWADAQIGTLLGLDRHEDFADAEREEPECVALVAKGATEPWFSRAPARFVAAVAAGSWRGRPNRLSGAHVDWPIVEEVARATRYPGPGDSKSRGGRHVAGPRGQRSAPAIDQSADWVKGTARSIVLKRRSALAFDAQSALRREVFLSMLRRLQPSAPPWDAVDWPAHVHLVLFVHRVEGLLPGIYAYLRDAAVQAEWRAAMRPEFLWERISDSSNSNDSNDPNDPNDPNDLYLLVPIDCRRMANRVSCDQEIAEDGFFSLGMIARLESSLRERGEWFYRRLFWECGLIGQILYLEAEAAGARATGIGCFYDDPVHDVLGLAGDAWQSLYHFSMGVPVEDRRLTSESGYAWEVAQA